MLFIDATFKSEPKPFYQIFNIIGHIDNKNLSIFLMKYKYESLYVNIFGNIKILLHNYNIKVNFDKIKIMTDFEKVLRNAIKYSFPNSICYFHYIKCIIKKIKELGLLKKKHLINVYKIILVLKLFPFLKITDKKEIVLCIVENYFKKNNNNTTYKLYRFSKNRYYRFFEFLLFGR